MSWKRKFTYMKNNGRALINTLSFYCLHLHFLHILIYIINDGVGCSIKGEANSYADNSCTNIRRTSHLEKNQYENKHRVAK